MELFYAIIVTLQLLTACQGLKLCGDDVARITPQTQIVELGSTAIIECQTNLSQISFWWNFIPRTGSSNAILLSANDHYHFPQNNGHFIHVLNVTVDQAGEYFCEKLNPPSCITAKSALTIFEKASIKITPKQNSKHVGETLDLTTVVTGNPLPASITLEKRDAQTGVYVDYPKTKYSVTSLNSVSIHELSLEDSGQYRACVDNSHSSIECDTFNIIVTGPPVIESIPPITVKDGGNLSVICRVVQSFDGNYEITWQMADGSEVDSDPFSQTTPLSPNELHLFVQKVTKATDYLCVVRNSSRILTTEHVSVNLANVPGPPRNLKIISANSDGFIYITWRAPATDNGSPLTAYYVNVTVEGANSVVIRIIPDTTSLKYYARCKMINVSVASENQCGNSSAISSMIDTRDQCNIVSDATAAESPESDRESITPIVGAGIAVVFVFVCLTLLAIIAFVVWWKRQKRELKRIPSAYNVEALSSNVKVNSLKMIVATTPPPIIRRTTSIRRYRSMLEVPKDNVMLRDVLYDSSYYELRKGLMTVPENENKTHEVMVKKAKHSAPSEEEHNIQEEIKMMSSVGVHENVVGLLRTCLAEPPAYLITEYFPHGDLLGFLRASRGHYGMYTISSGATHPCAIQAQDLLKMGTQVAAGMSYLVEKKVTHRSLCARNVLVSTGLQVKVYNYGPDSEDIPDNYAKWMAPEMLFDGTANSMSDIWSFGVTFWEIITIGGSPYPQTHPEQMRQLLQSGHRLPKPDHCTNALYTVMDQCWKMDPSMRPTFSVLHKQLDDMCKSKLSYLDSNLYNDEEYSQFEETHQLMTAL